MDDIDKKLIAAGHKDPSEIPFDEKEAEEPDTPDVDEEEKLFKMPYTLKLNTPVRLSEKSELVTELVFCNDLETSMITHLPVNAGHSFSDSQIGHHIPIISRMTGKNSAIIRKLKPRDILNAIGVVSHFFYEL